MKVTIHVCPKCAGRGFTKKGHLTNKRNKTKCTTCNGNGEILKESK